MNTLSDVKGTVRSIVGDTDPAGWLNDGYLTPKINYAYQRLYLYLKRGTGMNLEQMVEIPNVTKDDGTSTTQGLTTLSEYQQPGKPLAGLWDPLYMFWKPAGAPALAYREYRERKTVLPGQSISTQIPTSTWWGNNATFTWRGNQIFMTPINLPIDILVDGRFNPPPLTKDTDVLVAHPDMSTCVVPATMALIGKESGNGTWMAMDSDAEAAADDIVAVIVRGKQGQTARAGSNAKGCGWSWR